MCQNVTTVLVRYCEIGLKSTPVRKRFENYLRDNMLAMLANDGVEALIRYGDARFYFDTDEVDRCVSSLKKVFGIASVSVAEICSSKMEDICKAAADYSRNRMHEGESFAVRARREGSHTYTSMDVGREAGSAIFIANEDKHVKVDLHNPDKVFFIEIRNDQAYIFDSYIQCPGGLPMGSQGKVIADISGERGIVSAWLMMRRGCKVIVKDDLDSDVLRMYDPQLRNLTGNESPGYLREILAEVSGAHAEKMLDLMKSEHRTPVFFPTSGLTDAETDGLLNRIRDSYFDDMSIC